MQAVFDGLSTHDFVIVDLPGMSVSSDVNAIAPLLDAAIVVVEADKSTVEDVIAGIDVLQRANLKILGAVLNKARKHTNA